MFAYSFPPNAASAGMSTETIPADVGGFCHRLIFFSTFHPQPPSISRPCGAFYLCLHSKLAGTSATIHRDVVITSSHYPPSTTSTHVPDHITPIPEYNSRRSDSIIPDLYLKREARGSNSQRISSDHSPRERTVPPFIKNLSRDENTPHETINFPVLRRKRGRFESPKICFAERPLPVYLNFPIKFQSNHRRYHFVSSNTFSSTS